MTNDAFIEDFVMGLDSTAIPIVEFQLYSVGDMGDHLAIRLRSMQSRSDLFALWTDRHGSLCKSQPMAIVAIMEISYRPISDQLAFWKILAPYMALRDAFTEQRRSPSSGMEV